MRILIAEDDLTSRMVLSGVLKKNGHEVVETVRIGRTSCISERGVEHLSVV